MRAHARFFTLSLPQAWRILLSRKRLILITLAIALSAAVAINLFAPRRYVATVALVVDARGNDPLREGPAQPQPLVSYLVTQSEIISSRNVAVKVARKLAGDSTPGETATDAIDAATLARASALMRSLDVKTAPNSNVIHVSYSADDPAEAARTANAFAASYIETSLELQVDPARRQSAWFEEQLAQLRKDLTDAQARLSAYQREHNVLDVDEQRLDVENARLQEISTHLVNAQTAMFDAEARKSQVSDVAGEGQLNQVPDLLQHPLLQTLKSDLARAEGKLADMGERFDRNHPQYRSAAAEVQALRRKLASEVAVAKSSVVQAAQIARDAVAETQRSLDEQRARILALTRQRDELAVLNRDVQSARAAYDAALQQTNQTRLQSRVDRTNIAVLNPATVPMAPSAPRPLLNLALAVVLGLALGAALALYLEGLNPRVRSADSLEDIGLTVLAELPALPARPQRVRGTHEPRLLQARTA
jgi:succinoglycan biosynthesis transport protein ExoP